MKKSLIALAALATVATAAQAQSSVTLYGIVDSGFVSVNGIGSADQKLTQVSPGTLATSRWGVKGTEDLGGGLSAAFNLEAQLDADTGAANATLFNRQSFVSIGKSNVGTVALGRTTRFDFDLIAGPGDAFGAANFGGANAVIYTYAAGYTGHNTGNTSRYNNGVKVTSANFSGLTAGYQQSFGENAGSNVQERAQSYALNYTQGNLFVGYAGSVQYHDTTGGTTQYQTNAYVGSYNFGVAKAFVGYAEKLAGHDTTTASRKVKGTWVGATVPVNAKVNLMAQYSKIEDAGNVKGDDADVYAIGATYAFSNRTTAYALVGQSNNSGTAAVGVATSGVSGTVGSGKDSTAYAVGIRHTF